MSDFNRREWLVATGAAAAATLVSNTGIAAAASGFTLPPLPYAFDAMEPYIDAKTMEIHHDKHHKTYVDNLNKALAGTDWLSKTIDEVILGIPTMPADIQQAVINNGGGHYNHSLFWVTLGKSDAKPSEELLKAWGGTQEVLQKAVNEAATSRFGSGWAWVVYEHAGKKIKIMSTANQDCPLAKDETPVFGVDVWEHAYYLKYQNKRADYLAAFWNVLNWKAVNERFATIVKK